MLRVPYKLRLADSVCSIDTGLADGWISLDDIEEALERPMTCRPVHSVVFNLKLDEIGVDPATLGDLLYADGCDELAEGREEQEMMTEYVVTRWYRAPELLLSNETYGWEIDMWSVGCILAELLQRRPLFAAPNLQDSMAHLDQLKLIVKTLGSPSDEELEFVESRRARDFLKSLPLAPRVSFAEMFPEASPEAVDLCDRMLQFDPRKRITVEEALEHPFIAPLHKINSAPAAERPFSSDFEGIKLDRHELMDLVFQEILKIHPSPPGEAC